MTATDPAAVRREALEEAARIVEGCARNGRSLPSEMASAIRVVAVRPAEATGDAERVATRQRLREIILGWSGMDESDLEPIVDAAEARAQAVVADVARLTAERDAARELRDKWQREMSLERRLRSTCELHLHKARQNLAAALETGRAALAPATTPDTPIAAGQAYEQNPRAAEIEAAARKIYEGFAFLPGYVRWVPGGNSVKQNEARNFAKRALATRDTGSAPARPAPAETEGRDNE